MSESRFLAAEGKRIGLSALKAPKASQFAALLREKGAENDARLIEVRCRADTADVVVFEIKPERSQFLVHDVKRIERLAAVFPLPDDIQPGVFVLRGDFPLVPHVNQTKPEFPRSLCLYDEPFEQVRLNWTPANFLNRIHFWLSGTAKGTLHAEDQPLEPLIFATRDHLIVPADILRSLRKNDQLLHIVAHTTHESEAVYLAKWTTPNGKQPVNIAIPVLLKPQVHGIIRHTPDTLYDLNAFCQSEGVDLVELLTERIRDWLVNKPFPCILDTFLFLVLVLPKCRTPGGNIESYEMRGFLTVSTVQQVGAALGAIARQGGDAAYIMEPPKLDVELSRKVAIQAIQVHMELEPRTAALMNGVAFDDMPAVAVGAGAIGSQILNNWVRAGFGTWSIIDPDLFLTHNPARHLLQAGAVGFGKAFAVATTLNQTILNGGGVAAIPANILAAGKYQAQVEAALARAKLICDFSASIAVSRFLARSTTFARHLSAFLTPDGSGLVIALEDEKRKTRLDWLEMVHYRAVINEPILDKSLRPPKTRLRYGNSCRDVSVQLAQDDVAIWSGMAAKAIRRLLQSDAAAVEIYSFAGTGIHPAICPSLSKLRSIKYADWTIRIDEWLIEKLSRFRADKLPNETGGILLGDFDTHYRICSIIDALPSPPDSREWPTSYIRGFEGLAAQVARVGHATLGKIGYAGEWHSHPRGSPARPSEDDHIAHRWLCNKMNPDGLPGLMLIITDRKALHFVGSDQT